MACPAHAFCGNIDFYYSDKGMAIALPLSVIARSDTSNYNLTYVNI